MQGFGAPKKRKRKKNNNINDDFIKLEEAEKKLLLQKAFKNHQEGKISVAEKYYQIFIDKGFKDQKVFISYGKVLEQKGQFKKAIEIWSHFGYDLGLALSHAVNLLDPDVISIGGGISQAFIFFKENMIKTLNKYSPSSNYHNIEVVQSKQYLHSIHQGAVLLINEKKYN